MSNSVYLLIESGRPLALVKQFMADVLANEERVKELVVELGCERFVMDPGTHALLGVKIPKGVTAPDGFKKPNSKGISYPKLGSPLAKRLAAQTRMRTASGIITSEFDVPTSISYSTGDGGEGSRRIGGFFNECGFLWLGENGPFAMWIPDVEAEVQSDLARGYTVEEPARSFKPQIAGCRRIEIEEWEIMVAQDKLAEKRAAAAQTQEQAAMTA